MAKKANIKDIFNKADDNTTTTVQKFTGTVKAKLLGINPDNAQRIEWGLEPYKDKQGNEIEPIYVKYSKDFASGEETDIKSAEITAFFKINEPKITKTQSQAVQKELAGQIVRMSLWVNDEERAESKATPGNFQWTNGQFQFKWANSPENIQPNRYFSTEDAEGNAFPIRKALKNEELFGKFLADTMNKKLPIGLPDWDWETIFEDEDFSLVKQLVELSDTNNIDIMGLVKIASFTNDKGDEIDYFKQIIAPVVRKGNIKYWLKQRNDRIATYDDKMFIKDGEDDSPENQMVTRIVDIKDFIITDNGSDYGNSNENDDEEDDLPF